MPTAITLGHPRLRVTTTGTRTLLIGTVMVTPSAMTAQQGIIWATLLRHTVMPMAITSVRQQPRVITWAIRLRHIVTAMATLSEPQRRQQTIWVHKTRSNEVTPITHPSGRGKDTFIKGLT